MQTLDIEGEPQSSKQVGSNGAKRGGPVGTLKHNVQTVLLQSKLNALLAFAPLAVLAKVAPWGEGLIFTFSLLALCPLAERLGFITEQLALHTNDTLGGLLNASFGNATELIIAGMALGKGMVRVVQLSLLGSVLSNLLLVLGSAFLLGGFSFPQQRFNQLGMTVNAGLLMLAAMAVLLPTMLAAAQKEEWLGSHGLKLSRVESIVLLLCYGLFLLFQLRTHRHVFEEVAGGAEDASSASPGSEERKRGSPGHLAPAVTIQELVPGCGPAAQVVPDGTAASAAAAGAADAEQVSLEVRLGPHGGAAAAGSGCGTGQPWTDSWVAMSATPLNGSSRRLGSATDEEEELLLSSRSKSDTARSRRTPFASSPPASPSESSLKQPSSQMLLARTPFGMAQAADQDDWSMLDEETAGRDSSSGALRQIEVRPAAQAGGGAAAAAAGGGGGGGDADEEAAELGLSSCMVWLTIITALVSVLSEFIVGAIEGASRESNVPLPFLSTIVLPIVGNAAEHASAIIFACRNRMEIALGVAVGSSTQIAVLVVPLCVVVGWVMGQPMSLDFQVFESATLFLTVILVTVAVQDGSSNWLKGAVLAMAYAFLSAAFWLRDDPSLAASEAKA